MAAGPLWAQETATLTLAVPVNFNGQTCPSQVWLGQKVLWQGVEDKRTTFAVGLQTKKKGKEPIAVLAQPTLQETLESNLKTLLSFCGMQLTTNPQESDLSLKVMIEAFYAGVQRNILTGQGNANSRLVFSIYQGLKHKDVVITYQMEFKDWRGKSLKQLKKTLDELLTKTLEQIPRNPGLIQITQF